MKGRDLIQSDKDKMPLLGNNAIKNRELIRKYFKLKNKLDPYSNFWFKADRNIITNKNGEIIKWCDARRGKLYMSWQRFKYKIFGKI